MKRGARTRAVLLLLGVALLGAAGLRWALARGIGLSPDSVSYLDGAANVAAGRGYRSAAYNYLRPIPPEDYVVGAVSPGGVRTRPIIYFPPGYPAVLAVLIRAGANLQAVALWLAVVLFGLNALAAGWIARSFARGSTPIAAGAALVMLGSEAMLVAHSQALSEPLFICLCLAGLWLLTGYLEKERAALFAGAAAVSGLAFLTRYSGAALVGTGVVGLLFFSKKPVSKRMSPALGFLALSCVPIAAFILRGYLETGLAPINRPALRAAGSAAMMEAFSKLSSWVLPGGSRIEILSAQGPVLSLAAVAVLAAISAVCVRAVRIGRTAARVRGPAPAPRVPVLFAVFGPAYLASFLAAEGILKGSLLPDIRLLAPAFPSVVIVAAWWIRGKLDAAAKPGIRRAAAAALAAYALVYAGCGAYWMLICHRQGRGYNNSAFQAADVAPAIALVRAQGSVPIFTNDCGAVYFQAGRYAYQFPSRVGTKDPAVIAGALGARPACFVYYWTPAHLRSLGEGRGRDAFERGLVESLGLQTLVRSETMTVLWRPGRS